MSLDPPYPFERLSICPTVSLAAGATMAAMPAPAACSWRKDIGREDKISLDSGSSSHRPTATTTVAGFVSVARRPYSKSNQWFAHVSLLSASRWLAWPAASLVDERHAREQWRPILPNRWWSLVQVSNRKKLAHESNAKYPIDWSHYHLLAYIPHGSSLIPLSRIDSAGSTLLNPFR